MSGKVMTLGVAGAGSVDRQDEDIAADLANARIAPGQFGLTLVSVGRQNRLRAFIVLIERAFGPVAFVERQYHPESRDLAPCRRAECHRHNRITRQDVGSSLVLPER